MPNRQRNLGINIRVTPTEKKKIETNAKKCRISVSEYLRKIAMQIEPKELPSEDIENSFLRIRDVLSTINQEKNSSDDPAMKEFLDGIYTDLLRILVETLQLMRHIEPDHGGGSDGDD